MSTKFGGEIIDIDKDINVDILKKKKQKKYIHYNNERNVSR